MAVGVDYSLFYIRREREERARGAGNREALLRTAGTSGYAVFISALLSKLGDRVNRGKIPGLSRNHADHSRAWGAVLAWLEWLPDFSHDRSAPDSAPALAD